MPSLSLHEEYIERNNLNVVVVKYLKKVGAFLKNKNPDAKDQIRVLSFVWCMDSNHPGYYRQTYATTSPLRSMSYFHMDKNFINTYEQAVLDAIQKVKNDNFYAPKPEEQILTAWNFFLKGYDEILSMIGDHNFFNLIHESLNEENPLNVRTKAYLNCEKFLHENNNMAYSVWRQDILSFVAPSQSEWFINLINK